jgi:hypothetical protein
MKVLGTRSSHKKAGKLGERRIAALLGEGVGAAVIGELVLAPIRQALSR